MALSILGVTVIIAVLVSQRESIDHFLLTGSFSPIDIVETLENSHVVKSWTPSGLVLDDGRVLQLPSFAALPAESEALAEATKRGVEVNSQGRIVGLLQIHHWCGNDPVRFHLARVDLAHMLMFLDQGQFEIPAHIRDLLLTRDCTRRLSYWQDGWDVADYYSFYELFGPNAH